MSSTSTTQGRLTSTAASEDPVIRRIDDRFVSIQTGSVSKVVFSPLHPGVKLFDGPPPVPMDKPAGVTPVSPNKPASVAPVSVDKPASVAPVNRTKPASIAPVSPNKPASVAPVSIDKPASVAPVNRAKPASVAPVSTDKPTNIAPALPGKSAPSLDGLPEILPPQDDVADGHFVKVYGYPKAYPNINYAQGDAVPGYRGTCGEVSIANLLTIAGQKVTEADVVNRAIANGWCDTISSNPNQRGGTSGKQQRELLDSFGVATGVLNDYDPAKFAELIKQGRGVMLGVNGAELWGAKLPTAFLNWINVNHKIDLTGVAYSSNTGAMLGFYIADSARGFASDAARFISLADLEEAAHFPQGCDVIYTIDPIKKPGTVPIPTVPDALKPVYTEMNGEETATYGNPQANTQLDFTQGDALPGYGGTSGETCVANIAMLAGLKVSEKDVLQKAIAQKLCDTTSSSSELRGSTNALQQMALLKEYGIASTVTNSFDVASVAQSIKGGKGVIVCVDRNLLEHNSRPVKPGYVAHADQSIVITGVDYSAATNDVAGFYIADSGRGLSIDRSRYFSAAGMRKITNAVGVTTITTTDAIKLHTLDLSAAGKVGNASPLAASGKDLSTATSAIARLAPSPTPSTLADSQVSQLLQAMASFAPPAATQTNWHQTAGGNGKVLLTVTH